MRIAAFFVFLGLGLAPLPAHAQVHWDAGAQMGAAKRFLSEKPTGGDDAGFGPIARLEGHVAILPLLRVGAYFGGEISPQGSATRQIASGGLHARVMSPWPRDPWRAWLGVGLGYAGVYAPSYRQRLFLRRDDVSPPAEQDALVAGAGGSFFEVPIGIGVAYKLRRPWELTAELGCRIGFGFVGSIYEPPGRAAFAAGFPENRIEPAGIDRFAPSLTLGVNLEL